MGEHFLSVETNDTLVFVGWKFIYARIYHKCGHISI